MKYRGFWREFVSRDNSIVDSMVILSVALCAPIVLLAMTSLCYDIFYKGKGLTEVSVKLLIALIAAGAGGLAASRFSKRTATEMAGRVIGIVRKPPAKEEE